MFCFKMDLEYPFVVCVASMENSDQRGGSIQIRHYDIESPVG